MIQRYLFLLFLLAQGSLFSTAQAQHTSFNKYLKKREMEEALLDDPFQQHIVFDDPYQIEEPLDDVERKLLGRLLRHSSACHVVACVTHVNLDREDLRHVLEVGEFTHPASGDAHAWIVLAARVTSRKEDEGQQEKAEAEKLRHEQWWWEKQPKGKRQGRPASPSG